MSTSFFLSDFPGTCFAKGTRLAPPYAASLGSALPRAQVLLHMGGVRRPLPDDGACLGSAHLSPSYSVLRALSSCAHFAAQRLLTAVKD